MRTDGIRQGGSTDPDDFNSLSVMIDNLRDAIAGVSRELNQQVSLLTEELRTANLLALLPHLDDQARASTVTTVQRRHGSA